MKTKVIYLLESDILFKEMLNVSDVPQKGDFINYALKGFKVRYRVFDFDQNEIRVILKKS